MINEIQMKLLNKGTYTNSDIAKIYKTGARPVRVEHADGSSTSYTPNRQQRRQMSRDKWRNRNINPHTNNEPHK